MYQEHFHLREAPFTIAPDPRYLYLSDQHREALAHLLYGVKADGGFVLLTGEVGTGKTTICRGLVEQLPGECDVALVLNPRLTVVELLSAICDEFRIRYPDGNQSIKQFVDCLNTHLLEAHSKSRKSVLIIDEAQNLSASVLEQMRLLTNLETNRSKLLQIILLGQPELRDMLARPELRQLAQRIVARYHLGPLSKEDTGAYTHHRLAVAGARKQIFPSSTIGTLYRLSGGIPRLINLIADRALLGAYVEGKETVDRRILQKAAVEVLGDRHGIKKWLSHPWAVLTMAAAVALLVILGKLLLSRPLMDIAGEQASSSSTHASPVPAAPLRKPLPTQPKPGSPPQQVTTPEPTGSKPAQNDRSELSNLEWASDKPMVQSESMAFQALFDLWNVSYQAGKDIRPCDRAEAAGLSCLTGRGGLQDLLRLNHPAVLRLQENQEQSYHVTLTAIDGRTATVKVGAQSRTVALDELEQRWRGEFTLFWRAPPQYTGSLQVGDRGPVVDWLKQNLLRTEGRPEAPSEEGKLFDPSFQEVVKRFQTANGLKSDGIVGPHTIIRLNADVYSGDPHLTRLGKEG